MGTAVCTYFEEERNSKCCADGETSQRCFKREHEIQCTVFDSLEVEMLEMHWSRQEVSSWKFMVQKQNK